MFDLTQQFKRRKGSNAKTRFTLRTLLLAERLKKLVLARLLVVAVAGCRETGEVSVGESAGWP